MRRAGEAPVPPGAGGGVEAADRGAEAGPVRQRLDVWLFHARCVRTRSAAAQLVKAGRVRLNGARITAPSHPVRLGDVLTLALDSRVRLWRVAGFVARRGDAPAARATYVEVAPEPAPGSHAS
ncbi:ribosome-associated heat shock protein Hsp15 [Ancylobacter aquaticus]|uniref:Ribosome-associated heat shock protein Hsp15 n=1 Tax=Ancylobacter aquaticus TaxID=100 RepID=A0A4R1HN69_ANCAQ|nr:ribosome-associated heat shock protein Hsp15 [Ancylobacter aquaticus]